MFPKTVDQLKVVILREQAIEKLKEQQIFCQEVVSEAKKGYQQALHSWASNLINQLDAGKDVTSVIPPGPYLHFDDSLKDTLAAVTAHVSDCIEMKEHQAAAVCGKRWPWMESFLQVNAQYSKLALQKFQELKNL